MLGPNIKNQNQVDDDDEESNSDIANTLAQLIVFNSVKNYKLSEKGKRHNRSKETPATIYIAMVTHAETRKKSLVDKFYRLGLCISYDRLMQISTDLGNKVSEQFEKDGLVCPLDLRKDLFTTGCVDNIDHDPSSRTAKDSFHGTAISITQHPTADSQGVKRGKVVLDLKASKSRVISNLPDSYTNITPFDSHTKKDLFVTKGQGGCKPECRLTDESMQDEYHWLSNVESLLHKEQLDKADYPSWAGHFACQQTPNMEPDAITALMPLFVEHAHSLTMMQVSKQ